MQNKWTYCYRIRPSFRNLGVLGTAFMVGMTVFSVFAWVNQPANDPVRMPFVVSAFLLFTALYVYLLLLYYRYRLFVSATSIQQNGVLRVRHSDLSLIDELKWPRFSHSGSVRLSGKSGVMTIALSNLENDDRCQLVAFLRASIDESRQIGWQRFKDQVDDSPKKQKQTVRAYLVFSLIFGAHAVAFGIIWFIGGGVQFLVYSGINAAMAVYLLRSRRGRAVHPNTNVGEQSDAPKLRSRAF